MPKTEGWKSLCAEPQTTGPEYRHTNRPSRSMDTSGYASRAGSVNDGRRPTDPSVMAMILAALILAVACSAAYLMQPGFLADLNYKWMDAIENAVSATEALSTDIAARVVVVDIDEASLSAYGQWPWPRYQLAELLQRIRRFEPRSIALTFILAEPDRTSLTTVQAELKNHFNYQIDLSQWPAELLDNDARLTQTLSTGPFVLAFKFLFQNSVVPRDIHGLHPLTVMYKDKAFAAWGPSGIYQALGAVKNLPRLDAAVSRSGFLNGQTDADGRLRRLPLVMRWEDKLYPALALAAMMAASGDTAVSLQRRSDGQEYLVVSDGAIPLDPHGNVQLRFFGNAPAPHHVSAAAILRGETEATDFSQAIVFVGLTAAGLDTAYPSPGGESLSSAQVHARLTQTLLRKRFINRPDYMRQIEIGLALVVSMLFGACIARMEFMGVTITGVGGIVLLQSMALLLLRRMGLQFSPLLPAATLTANWLLLMLYKYAVRQKTAHRHALKAMQMARRSERNLNSIVKTIPDIVFRLDPQGCITFISAAVSKYQKRADELIGKPVIDLVAPEQREAVMRQIKERRSGQRATTDMEVKLLLFSSSEEDPSEDGRFFSVSAEGIYSREAPDATGFLGTQGIARDIHRRKKLEQQLEQAKKMEAIGSLAAGVAHDLNNLLSGLVSYPELLLYELPEGSPLRDKVDMLRLSGQQAADMVQDMLCIARRGIQDFDIVQLNDVVRLYLKMPAGEKIKQHHPAIDLRTSLTPDLLNVKGSVVHLTKLILNLVNNAAEAMPAGGTITLATLNRYLDVEVSGYEKIPVGEYVLLTVDDQGVGIPTEYLHRIFEPFFSKKKMGHSGSGLGMTVVWGTVKDHGGFVDIQSREGQGTRFDIYLPATREEKPAAPQRIVLQDYIGHERILVVDDGEDQLDIAVKMLTKLGYQVAGVASGEAGVAYLQEHPVDLVVLDMIMPEGMDGLDTYRRMLEIRPGQAAVIVSGYSESQRVQTMLELGAGAYVRKPYSLEKIGLAIRRVLDQIAQP